MCMTMSTEQTYSTMATQS